MYPPPHRNGWYQYGLRRFFFRSLSSIFAFLCPISTGLMAVSSAFLSLIGRLPTYLPVYCLNGCNLLEKVEWTYHPFPSMLSGNPPDLKTQQIRTWPLDIIRQHSVVM